MMIKTLKMLMLLLLCLATFSTVHAQSSHADKDMAKFFVGSWSGAGKLANGKTIEADVTFTLATDSSCLISMYADRAPNVFKAAAVFGVDDMTRKFYARFLNNFTGLKDFTSD